MLTKRQKIIGKSGKNIWNSDNKYSNFKLSNINQGIEEFRELKRNNFLHTPEEETEKRPNHVANQDNDKCLYIKIICKKCFTIQKLYFYLSFLKKRKHLAYY